MYEAIEIQDEFRNQNCQFFYSAQVNSFAYFWAYVVHINIKPAENLKKYFSLFDHVEAQSHI